MTIIDIRNSYKNMYEKGKKEGYEKAMKEVEEVLDNYPKGKGDWYKYYIKIKDLKQALNLKTGDCE